MNKFTVHTKATAPEKAVPVLEAAEQAFGFIPNLLGVMANSPATVDGYYTLRGLDHERLTYRYAGRNFRLTDIHGHIVKDIIA